MPAVAALGCASRFGASVDLAYAGTGSAQTTGEAAADLGYQEVDLKVCNGVRRRFTDEPQYFAAIAVGRACVIPAEEAGRTLVGSPGSNCTLLVDGRVHRLRVTDATATFGVRALWTRYGVATYADDGVVSTRIGGDESDGAGHVRHSLFLFEGPLTRTGDAATWCVSMLPKPPPPPVVPRPLEKEPEGQTYQANGF